MKDTKQVAEMTLETIKSHLDHCNIVKKKITRIARNVRKGISVDLREITGEAFLDIIEVTSLAPIKYINSLHNLREKLEREIISTVKHAPSVAMDVREFLNIFYRGYGVHYRTVFGEQLKALVAAQSILSKSSMELAKAGARDIQDNSLDEIKSGIDNSSIEEVFEDWIEDDVD